MLIEELHIENIKGFSRTDLSFLTESGEPATWVSLYGESGTGKTTLLQILSLLLAGIEGATQLLPYPKHWLRDERMPGRIWFDYRRYDSDMELWIDEEAWAYGEFAYIRRAIRQRRGLVFVGSQPLKLKYMTYTEDDHSGGTEGIESRAFTEPAIVEADQHMGVDSCDFSTSSFANTQGYFAAAYSLPLQRRYSDEAPAVSANEQDTRVTALGIMFATSSPLAGPGTWAQYLSHRASKGDERAGRNLAEAHSYLEYIKEVEVGDGQLPVLFSDLFWKLIMAFPDSDDFFQEEGVVLIDNLDALSAELCTRAPDLLHRIFPKLQFITASRQCAPLRGEDTAAWGLSYGFKTMPIWLVE